MCQNILADRMPFSGLESDNILTFWDKNSTNYYDFKINRASIGLKMKVKPFWLQLISTR